MKLWSKQTTNMSHMLNLKSGPREKEVEKAQNETEQDREKGCSTELDFTIIHV